MSVFEEAVRKLHAGDGVGAETLCADHLKQTLAGHDAGSLAVAQARFELSTILLNVGNVAKAIAELRLACALTETSEAARREKLTFQMNLGEILHHANELAEAEAVFRQGLTDRAAFYGEDHPGYAFVLEPLAELRLSQGDPAEARTLLERCNAIFAAHRHPRLPQSLALTVAAHAPDKSAAAALEGLDLPALQQVAQAALDKAGFAFRRSDLVLCARWLDGLDVLRDTLAKSGTSDGSVLVQIVSTSSNLARRLDDHPRRIAAFEWLVAYLQDGKKDLWLEALQGLALAHSDAGDVDAAVAVYERASEVTDAGVLARSQLLRNHGLFLAELERRDDAEAKLREAVAIARGAWGGGGEMLGRALVALGIFVQHGAADLKEPARPAALQEAATLLREALEKLPPSHADGLPARSHLQAIEHGGACGCGDMSGAISDALRAMVLPQLPDGLLKSIAYVDGNLDVQLARQPSEEELALLDRVVRQALAELQKNAGAYS